MSTRGKSIADRNRQIREEEHRRKIAESGQITYILNNIQKMQELAEETKAPTVEEGEDKEALSITSRINHLQMVNNQRFKLLDKILPDLKAVEMEGDVGLKLVEINRTGIHDDEESPEEE